MSCSFLLRICQPSTATCRCCITELWLSDSQRAKELCPTSSNTTCQSWTPLRRFWRIFPTENLGNPHASRDVVLLMRRSPLSLLCRENLPPAPSALSHFWLPLSISLLQRLSSPFDDGWRFIGYLRGSRRACVAGGQWAKPKLCDEALVKPIMRN